MTNVEVEDLIATLEKIRSERYPGISESLMKNIVIAEFGNQDNRVKGQKETQKVIEEFLRTLNG